MYTPVYKPPVALPYGSRMPQDDAGHHLRRLRTLSTVLRHPEASWGHKLNYGSATGGLHTVYIAWQFIKGFCTSGEECLHGGGPPVDQTTIILMRLYLGEISELSKILPDLKFSAQRLIGFFKGFT